MTEQSKSPSLLDFSALMGKLDPTALMDQLSKALGEYQIPGVNISTVLESQGKNMEALITANRQVLESAQMLTSRQSELLNQTLQEVSTSIKDLTATADPKELSTKQAELVKRSVEKALIEMRSLADIATTSNAAVFNTLNKRFTESLRDIRQIAQKLQP
jgi:phasin family protein